MRAPFVIVTAVALLVAACAEPNLTGTPQIKDINVFAAASLTDAFTRVYDEYAESNARVRFIFNFGSSSTLATQITNGAPADVFASANTSLPAQLYAQGVVDKPVVFARNALVVVVPKANPAGIKSVYDLTKDGVKVDIANSAVPVGSYTQIVLSRLAAAQRRVLEADIVDREPECHGELLTVLG